MFPCLTSELSYRLSRLTKDRGIRRLSQSKNRTPNLEWEIDANKFRVLKKMWIIVISHLVAASCWSNSLKVNYDACPFFKCRWHSSDRVLRWHLRNRVETVISYSWWRLLTVYWLKQRVDALPNAMHLSISFCCSRWSSGKLPGKWGKCPPASACRYRRKTCVISEVETESRRLWAASDCYIPANGSTSRGGAFVRHTALMDVVQSEHSGSCWTVCFPLQPHAQRMEVRRGRDTEDFALCHVLREHQPGSN